MKKSVVILLHVLYWLRLPPFFFALLTWDFPFTNSFVFYEVLPTLSKVLAFYVAYFLLFPYFLARKKIAKFTLASAATLLGSYWLAWSLYLFLREFYDFSSLPELLQSINRYSFTLYFGECLSGYIAGCLLQAFITWYSDIRTREALKQKQVQAELALLKAKISPHFLFNTLNNIDTMILKNPETASVYLNKLSDLLRFTLYESSDQKILLRTEIEYIQKYIDLQSVRTHNNKFVSFRVEGDPGGLQIVPLLFMLFIENAFKHATNKKTEQAIDIVITIHDGTIMFTCSNVVADPTENVNPGGLGMEIIKSRLAYYYPDHTLAIQFIENRYTVLLNLPS